MYQAIRDLLEGGAFSVIESFSILGQEARYDNVPDFLSMSQVGSYLAEKYPNGLWAHQSKALDALRHGENVVISTGTASGKSLIFQSIAFHKIMTDDSSRIVVFYPLKALVADQLRSWKTMARSLNLDESVIGQIDGTVKVSERDGILQNARIIIMTPDVCQAWMMARLTMPTINNFVGSLSLAVIDESHSFESVFGSNFAFLIRRLAAARSHIARQTVSAQPLQIVGATATIANPDEHLENLTGAKFVVVNHNDDGAPRYDRFMAHVACEPGEEIATAKALQRYAIGAAGDGTFIAFVDSRKTVENLAMSAQRDVEELAKDRSVAPYRAGYTAEQRQIIENHLQKGTLRGVVSTAALELGIDLPHLTVGFNVGIPFSRKSYRQRIGRVGRSGPGVFIVIGTSDAFRRYGVSFREYHDMSVEPSYLYLDNRFMQFAHARCLAEERHMLAATTSLPTRIKWPEGFAEIYATTRPDGHRPREFDEIARLGGDTPHWGYPLRNVGETSYDIRRRVDADSIGTVSQAQALRECYPGATYLHNMEAFEVLSLGYKICFTIHTNP